MNFKLIVISSPSSEPNETEAIISLFKAGLKIFHLRKPAMSEKKMNSFVSAVPKKYHSRMIIHSHYSLAKKYDLGGIHFSEKERNKNSEPRAFGTHMARLTISYTSTLCSQASTAFY